MAHFLDQISKHTSKPIEGPTRSQQLRQQIGSHILNVFKPRKSGQEEWEPLPGTSNENGFERTANLRKGKIFRTDHTLKKSTSKLRNSNQSDLQKSTLRELELTAQQDIIRQMPLTRTVYSGC